MASRLNGTAALAHPAFDGVRPWLARCATGRWPTLDELNRFAAERNVRTVSGQPVRFVPAGDSALGYELLVHAHGTVPTRTDNIHDLFNALCWIAYPRAKSALNARHVEAMPNETGRRGPLRDLLTVFDEGGALIACADASLEALARAHRWRELFWDVRDALLRGLRIVVFGHAVMEKALEPWPGVTCKALYVPMTSAELAWGTEQIVDVLDAAAARWIASLEAEAAPRLLPAFPVFGYPGWMAGSASSAFYDDTRYFRPRNRVNG